MELVTFAICGKSAAIRYHVMSLWVELINNWKSKLLWNININMPRTDAPGLWGISLKHHWNPLNVSLHASNILWHLFAVQFSVSTFVGLPFTILLPKVACHYPFMQRPGSNPDQRALKLLSAFQGWIQEIRQSQVSKRWIKNMKRSA